MAAGFSTHPHWDHLLWHAGFGEAPRYGTARCAAAIGARLSDPDWKAFVAGMIPQDIVEQVPLDDLFGRITGLPAGTSQVPWDGPRARIIEHAAHAPGHAALLLEDSGVLVAGDLLSDVLVPILNVMAEDPVEDYLAALLLLDAAAGDAEVVVPGHGSVGGAGEVRARIDRDRAYARPCVTAALRTTPGSARRPRQGWEWVTDLHDGQVQQLAHRRASDGQA